MTNQTTTKFPDLKVGDKVFLRSYYSGKRDSWAIVSKVGTKYFYVEGGDRFCLSRGQRTDGHFFNEAWPSEDAYLADRKRRDHIKHLALHCRNESTFAALSPEDLATVAAIVGCVFD